MEVNPALGWCIRRSSIRLCGGLSIQHCIAQNQVALQSWYNIFGIMIDSAFFYEI